jgi:DNA processing protein
MIDRADALARIRLARSNNVGPVTFRMLLGRFGSAAEALRALPDLAKRGGGKGLKIATMAEAEQEYALIDRFGGSYLFWGAPGYPALLAELENAPPVLTVKGDLRLLDRPAVALVGARNASAAAQRFARQLAADLGQRNHVTVSGLARGIDTAAHQGSLDSGTIAVIAGGIDTIYPPENAALQADIATRGLLIAEQPPGITARAHHFPFRNRIIAGLAMGTVVVEAAPRSGSLITARLAAEAGREVMAVPGSPLDPRAQGCNLLVRQGAVLIQSASDVIEQLSGFDGQPRFRQPELDFRGVTAAAQAVDASADDRQLLIDLLGPVAVPVDELIRQSTLSPAIVQTVLLELELAGRLERHAGGRVSLIL